MKKKIFISLLVFLLCFVMIGCGKTTDENDNDDVLNNPETNNVTTLEDDVKLYSDNTKYVFEYGNTKYVFYYSGDKITAYHTYVNYESASTAKAVYNALKLDDYEDLDKVSVKGKYLLFEWNKSTYEDLSASELKTVYSYMRELKEE